ncbi:MAG: molybdenum cofactor guanylyltransferase [Candidatus Eisenbacteria bacterium]|uniref:Molybdenum cofactor guanylyltransferase n=1 Tax=Eiseniibacteriota bacterium TaxID=2212470 RepID=A0A956M4E4_UNCEI|nr:molybdenum cofactor guanylyltransferase [Candidatus Eisenbacteria bacterium]
MPRLDAAPLVIMVDARSACDEDRVRALAALVDARLARRTGVSWQPRPSGNRRFRAAERDIAIWNALPDVGGCEVLFFVDVLRGTPGTSGAIESEPYTAGPGAFPHEGVPDEPTLATRAEAEPGRLRAAAADLRSDAGLHRLVDAIEGELRYSVREKVSGALGVVLAGGRSRRMGRDKAALPMIPRAVPIVAGIEPRGGGHGDEPTVLAGASGLGDQDVVPTWLEKALLLLARRFAAPCVVGRDLVSARAAAPHLREVAAHPDRRLCQGPLGGIAAALEVAGGGAVLVTPCDMPDLALTPIDRLLEARGAAPVVAFSASQGAEPVTRRGAEGMIEPSVTHSRERLAEPSVTLSRERLAEPVLLVETEALPLLCSLLDEGERALHRFLQRAETHWLDIEPEFAAQFRNCNTPESLEG